MIREILHAIARLFTWFIVIAPWERAVRVRCGRWVKVCGGGIFLKIPFIDRYHVHTIRRRLAIIEQQTLTTSDGHTITLAGSLGFQIDDLLKVYQLLSHPEETIQAEVGNIIAEYVFSNKLEDCRPSLIVAHVRRSINLSHYGLGSQEFYLNQFVAGIRTFRLMQGEPRSYSYGPSIGGEMGSVA